MKGELVKRKRKIYYNPVEVKATIRISDANGTFDGLFNGNEELCKSPSPLHQNCLDVDFFCIETPLS